MRGPTIVILGVSGRARGGGLSMQATPGQRLTSIDWGAYDTAYGPAVGGPALLAALRGGDPQAGLDACDALDNALCHQHVMVGSAALPALPFLLEALDGADAELSVELLDLLLGLAVGTNRRRAVEHARAARR